MQFNSTFFSLAAVLTLASAIATPLERRIADPANPANPVNCEPGGGADDCHLEKPVSLFTFSAEFQNIKLKSLTVQPHPHQLRRDATGALHLVRALNLSFCNLHA